MRKIVVLILLGLFSFQQSFSINDTLAFKNLIDKTVDNKMVFGVQVAVLKNNKKFQYASGNLKRNEQFFIASTTKLFVTTIILQLVEKSKLNLTDSISKYLSPETMKGLHVLDGKDYSYCITIENLLAHTSGLPDYFDDKIPNEELNYFEKLCNGQDEFWSFNELITLSKTMKPKFAPGTKNSAHYSDTNFQLLGKIIENILNKSLKEVYQEFIFNPLSLKKTYVFENINDTVPKNLYYESKPLLIPKAMSSFSADGGIVSNATELNIFIEAFFNGKLFNVKLLPELYEWQKIMYPLQYGKGIMMAKLPATPQLMGHSGLSGAFAFYIPEKDAFISGTVNQIAKPETSFKMLARLIRFI